ncbi:DUF2059 domain-containing protein [Euhalothece natronophila Z-M001]|uniref:DUF2059 domain-containing protein n=1 Tax=Euhalothece natronophila Z-M001 TaxID=522448 RepID=A0A5B8NNQ2_9CHRO|nr:DUF2059 domain-containing protein [Euhalothece natronophila]QDZ39830.1 DUF2059 domain-containing protein [Euhalothece natronophila Z-M001]
MIKQKLLPITLATILTPVTLGLSLLAVSSVKAETNDQNIKSLNETPSEQEKDVDPEKASLIRQYIELSNEKEATIETVTLPLEQNPQIPNEVVQEYVRRMEEEYVDLVTPIYAEHFTVEQLEAIIEFYQSDIGQSVAEEFPELTHDTFTRFSTWGERTMREIIEERREAN